MISTLEPEPAAEEGLVSVISTTLQPSPLNRQFPKTSESVLADRMNLMGTNQYRDTWAGVRMTKIYFLSTYAIAEEKEPFTVYEVEVKMSFPLIRRGCALSARIGVKIE